MAYFQESQMLPLALFDEIEYGLVVCDSDGLIHFSNRTAEREMDSERMLVREDNRLQVSSKTEAKLSVALLQAGHRGRRSLLTLVADGDRLMVSVLPLCAVAGEAPRVLVMLGRRGPCSDLGLEMLASGHGLTLAEKRVLASLVHGATPREVAAQYTVAMSTVRTQIASIRAKLGARSMDDLVIRAAELPPIASALRMASSELRHASRPAPSWLAAA